MNSSVIESFVSQITAAVKHGSDEWSCVVVAVSELAKAPAKKGEKKEDRHARLIKEAYAALAKAKVDGEAYNQYVRSLLWGFMVKTNPVCVNHKKVKSVYLEGETRAAYFERVGRRQINDNAAAFKAAVTGAVPKAKTGGRRRASTAPKVQGGQSVNTGNVQSSNVQKTTPPQSAVAEMQLHATEAEIGGRIDQWLADPVEAANLLLALINRKPALAKAGIAVTKTRAKQAAAKPAAAAA